MQKLNIELTNGDDILANCSFLEAAKTESALNLTESIIHIYDDIFGGSGGDIYKAVKIFEVIGAGITGIEHQRIINDKTGRFDNMDFLPIKSFYNGALTVSDSGIQETRMWEYLRVRIDLSNRSFDFHAHRYTYMEEYIALTDIVGDIMIPWDELPIIDAGFDIFTGIYFDRIDMIRRIIETYPNGFRLKNGDVIEWM